MTGQTTSEDQSEQTGTQDVIAVAADHAGFGLKQIVADALRQKGYEVLDLGTTSEESVDYPDYGRKLAEAIIEGKATRGVGICGSGIGISIALNRYPEIRAALCHNEESARLSRQHNNANVLALGARTITPETALLCLDVFLSTAFEGGRHVRRVEKLSAC